MTKRRFEYRRFAATVTGLSSGKDPEEVGPTARTVNDPVQLKVSIAVKALSSVYLCAPYQVVAVVLYTHSKLSTV